jgi:GNAT superfamily N-acetyltransferase
MVSEVETNTGRDGDAAALHALLIASFSGMAERIDPPSSMTRMAVEDVRRKLTKEDLFVIRRSGGPVACLFAVPQGDAYYLGKLAVREDLRGHGLATRLVDAAADRAKALGLDHLELQTRVELTENQATFRAMGFVETGRTAHPGYDRPTSITFRRALR